MKLSTGQLRALTLLAERRCYTTHATHGSMNVSGLAAKSLVRKGFARYVRGWAADGGSLKRLTVVEITNEGRAALEAAR